MKLFVVTKTTGEYPSDAHEDVWGVFSTVEKAKESVEAALPGGTWGSAIFKALTVLDYAVPRVSATFEIYEQTLDKKSDWV